MCMVSMVEEIVRTRGLRLWADIDITWSRWDAPNIDEMHCGGGVEEDERMVS